MSNVTWEYLSMRQQEVLEEIILGNGALVSDPQMRGICSILAGHSLVSISIEGSVYNVDPTDKGREVYAQLLAAPPPSATPADGGEGASPLDTNISQSSIDIWPKMFHGRATMPEWEGLYNEQAKHDMLDALDVIATLTAQLADARSALDAARRERDRAIELVNKAHKVLQDVERWLPTDENFDLGAHYYSEVHSAWKAGAWIRNYWLHLAEKMDTRSLTADQQAAEGG